MEMKNSKRLFEKAQQFIPGGVNSPVRAFKAVGGKPVFIKRADGAYIYDEDDNAYIELINSWGPMILGHNHPIIREAVIKAMEKGTSFGAPTALEVEVAELIAQMVPSVEKVRMVNSGTDAFLISASSGVITMGDPDSPGVTKGTARDTLLAPHNDLEAVRKLIEANKGEIAAIILEPVAGNMGLVLPKNGYLQGLRQICDKEGIILIFDEVMTGFRLSAGGAQALFDVKPDLTTLGKIIGGGMPVGAYGGKKEIMDYISPVGPVYQAGTLSGNPIAMAAGLAMLNYLHQTPSVYEELDTIGHKLVEGMQHSMGQLGLNYTVNHLGSMYSLFFTQEEVFDFNSAQKSDTLLFGRYFQAMLKRGVYLAPSQFESLFLSTALKKEHVDKILRANEESLKEIMG
jgi:glutamate-1-semialdehyde 2,1-aminomutase